MKEKEKQKLEKNTIHTVDFHDLNNLGFGVGRIGQTVVFADGAIDGERAEVKIIKVAKDYVVGRVEKILTPSPDRIPSDCPVSRRCGGCAFRQITYEHEKQLKRAYVQNAFRKARVEVTVGEVLSAGETDHTRNKAAYPISEKGQLGFYARHSHEIIPTDTCLLGQPCFDAIAAALGSWLQSHPTPSLRHLVLRRACGTGETMVCLVSRDGKLHDAEGLCAALTSACPEITGIVLNLQPEESNVILGRTCRTLFGRDWIEDTLRGLRFRLSPLSFYQVNRDGAEILYGEAISRIRMSGASSLCDLYCGTGTIGLCAAHEIPSLRVTGTEIVPEAVENAKENAERNGIENAVFLCGDAMKADLDGFDCIVTDPPRKGMAPELIEKLIASPVRYLVYVSCNPDTLARDAAMLINGGFTTGEVTPVDMFPRTGAVESVCLFTRETDQPL